MTDQMEKPGNSFSPEDDMHWRMKLFDSLSYPCFVITPAKVITAANQKFFDSFRLEPEDVIGKKCHHSIIYKGTPCDSEKCPILKVINEKTPHRFTVKQHHRWEERTFSPVFDDQNNVAFVIGSIRDITHIKLLENQLHGAQEFIHQVIFSSASAIVAADRQGNISLMNSVAKELFISSGDDESAVKHTEQLYPPGKAQEIMKMLRDEKGGGPGKLLLPRATIVNTKGEKIDVEMSAAIIYDEKGNESATMAIYNDLKDKSKVQKELKQAQAQLARSEKMASLGQLAAGVAHEINNPLTGILFYSSLLLEQDNLDEKTKEDIGYILEDANRCKEIVKNLLVYSRSAGTKMGLVQLNEIVEQSLTLIRDQKKFRNISIKKVLSPEMMLIHADKNKLNQVLINLIMNAADAMDNKGTITLSTYKIEAIKKTFLEVKDTGTGIFHKDLSKIFDPFFTTKEVGKSTGLGLSIVYGIIEEHDGRISVKKTGAKGTTFIIEFPMYLPSDGSPDLCGDPESLTNT
jgi:two-component system NtrC family sensor kinase